MSQRIQILFSRSEILCYQQSFSGASGAEEMMKKKTGEGWIFAARLFNKIGITMRQLAEAMVYAAALFLPVLFVIGGMDELFHYIKTHIWLQLWVPIFVLLNAFADYQLSQVVEAALNNPDIPVESLGISFQNLETLRTHANLILGYIGAFSWSVPTLAWGPGERRGIRHDSGCVRPFLRFVKKLDGMHHYVNILLKRYTRLQVIEGAQLLL